VTVLFVMSVAERRGGAEKMLWLLLREHDPTRIAPSVVFLQDGPFVGEASALGIPTAVIDAGRMRAVGRGACAVGRLARVIGRTQPDVIFSWMGKAHLYAGPAAALAGRSASTAWWLHDIPSFTPIDRAIQAVPAAAVGSSSAIGAQTLGGLRPWRDTFVVRPGVEDFMTADSEEPRAAARRRLGVGADDVVVSLIGRFHPQKGQDRFVQALASLRAEGVPFHGLLVGGSVPGQHERFETDITRLISRSGLTDAVTRVDHVDEPWGYLLASDVYVNARVRENLSLGILEAACAGRAIVAVASGGTPEILQDGVSGLLVNTPDPASLAAAIRRLVENPDLRVRLGGCARECYEERFTVARMVDELQHAIILLATA
jgi:glycosyltransferase involved in cell wall biosynthesis